jgi:hypothetical protein
MADENIILIRCIKTSHPMEYERYLEKEFADKGLKSRDLKYAGLTEDRNYIRFEKVGK